jgi:hypothetical protein
MRIDFITKFNGSAEAFGKHVDEMIAMKRAEVERLEKVRSVISGIASVDQMPTDPEVAGDHEPLPSIARPLGDPPVGLQPARVRPIVPAHPPEAA